MKSTVFYGSPRQSRLDAGETLPAKLDLIIDRLHIRDRVKGETVAIKMHTGSGIGYSTIHPLFVRHLVQAVKDGGGKPFIADISVDVDGCESRGYTTEVVGCPIYPAAGPDERYAYSHHYPFKNIQDWKVAGMVEDASFLIGFAHIKGHPACGFGGAFKNVALGCMTGETRSAMHDTCHYDPYWFPEKCTDPSILQKLIDVCPQGAIVKDKHNAQNLHLHFEECNCCGRCLEIAPEGSLKIDPVNFLAFQEACAISTRLTLSTFEPQKTTFISLGNQITPVCDCFGFTGMSILPDIGILGSDDIVAIDQAALDLSRNLSLIDENVPASMEVIHFGGHPFAELHGKYKDPYKVVEYGEKLGLGSRDYELVDILPVQKPKRNIATYISAK